MNDLYDDVLEGVCWTIPIPEYNIGRHVSVASWSPIELGVALPELDLNDMELKMLKEIMGL